MKLLDELKRRNVIKATIAYIVVAWILMQLIGIVLPNFDAPPWVFKTLTFVISIGLPIWMIFSWVYEVTPEGLRKTAQVSKEQSITTDTNKRLNIIIIITLIIAILISFINEPILGISSNNNFNNKITTDNSIAVLYFTDMSEGNDSEWFCDGVMEDILTYLSKIKGLRVIPRKSVIQYKNSDKTIPKIAQELGVAYVVDGSVRKQEDTVLISAQLIKANDDLFWAEKYKEKLEDIFKIQNKVSKEIVHQLKVAISPEEEKELDKIPTAKIEAYLLFLKGRSIAERRTKGYLENSIELYKQSIILDPNYVQAYVEIANSYLLLSSYGYINDDLAKIEIESFIHKALDIDPKAFGVYNILGLFYNNRMNWEKARQNFEKAIVLNPNDANAHYYFALYFRDKPILDAKNYLIHMEMAEQLDPSSSNIKRNKVMALLYNGKIKEAEKYFNKIKHTIGTEQENSLLGHINSLKNKDWTESIRIYKTMIDKDPANPMNNYWFSVYYSSVLHDYVGMLEYAKRAYNLDAENVQIAGYYFLSLLMNKMFDQAKELLNNSNFIDKLSDEKKNNLFFKYHYYQENYLKALFYSNKLNNKNFELEALIFAKLADTVQTYYILNNHVLGYGQKARVFAILKQKDSMYYYLNRLGPLDCLNINDKLEFEPYRKEPKFKAFLKKNYFPYSK